MPPLVVLSAFTRNNGRAAGNWFANRGRQAHVLRRLVPTRGRVELVGAASDGTPIVESTLDTTLRSFLYVGADNRQWGTAALPPGQRVALEPAADRPWSDLANPGGTAQLGDIAAAAAPKQPGRWLAHGGASALAPIATLAAIRWTDDLVVYTGAVASPGLAAAAEKGARP
jgi:hypothetical protein